MFEVVYMKADYEPWWMFEGWEEDIVSRESFAQKNEAEIYLHAMIEKLHIQYTHQKKKDDCFYAFWTTSEKFFCEGCDDDLQIFHGVILLLDGKPYTCQ